MRYILIFWGVPMGLFWGWYFLSYNDINFGLLFFSRAVHDFAFEFYGNILGIDPTSIGPMVARASVVDTLIIFSILAFRRRKTIMAWWKSRSGASALREAGPVHPAK